jgi:hypothetical protein
MLFAKLWSGAVVASLFALLAVGLNAMLMQPALAACDPNTEQQVSIGFFGAVERDGTWCVPLNKGSANIEDNPIIIYLKGLVQFLAVGMGVGVVGGFVYGAIVRMTARANPGQIQKSEGILRMAIIGLILYIFAFALINFLVPGGALN